MKVKLPRKLGLYLVVIAAVQLNNHAIAGDEKKPLSALLPVTVYKSPTCGCCQSWVNYLRQRGFKVTAFDLDNVDKIKAQHGLTDPSLKSCHTALVGGYVIEGHVPVSDIEKLLAERPDVVGLTAPGMPMMSPGMGSLIPENYDVLAFDKDGHATLFSSH